MSELEIIESVLERAGRRRRWARALRGLWQGLLYGGIVSLLFAGAYHFWPLPLWTLWVAALSPVVGMLLGAGIGGWRKPGREEVARWVDDRQRLKERLSTALEVAGDPAAGQWRELILADAAAHAGNLDVRRLLPFRLPRSVRWALLVLVLSAGLGFVPEYRSKTLLQKQAEADNLKETGRQLAELTRRSLERRPPTLEPTRQSLESVAQLGDQLANQKLTRSEALRDLASAAEKLKQQLDELTKDPALRRLEQAARNAGAADSQTAAALQKQIEALQKQVGAPGATPENLEKLKNELEKLQQAARGLDPNSGGSEAQRQKLSDTLSALSRQAQDLGLQLPELDEAIAALAASQTELFLKNLDTTVKDLEKMREMAKTLQQLQQQAEKIGKDLAEQLKNGQPDAAQMTLEKMARELNQANLTPEQLEKIEQEVSQALDPAQNYENVAEHLKKAVQQMKQGEKAGASQSLAAAAKELEKLMQQMGDAQQMAAAVEALEQASMCVGTGQGWRLSRQPGYKPGGKPGSGVGTWAEEGGEWDGQWTGGWDNSGITRPGMDPRGLSDRGPGELSDALKPTKVKGQFSPGNQMPSITLKGVSIKGQSTVGYQEAAAAAQTDAESALSQEKVPRAYQGAVRDYFDDLKK
jgi:chemotaxis protein histidine kinase CheA